MGQADAEQGQAAPPVQPGERAPGDLGALDHHREAHAEQQREQGEELALHEEVDQAVGDPVGASERRIQTGVGLEHGPDEGLHVHQQDAAEREAAQHVQGGDAFAGGDGIQLRRVHRGLRSGGRAMMNENPSRRGSGCL